MELSDEKIYSTLRSLYRYKEMTDGQYPDVLLDAEAELLKRRMAMLDASEIFEVVTSWAQFLTEETVIDEEDNKEFQNYLLSLN